MRFAVINAVDNTWEFESSKLRYALDFARDFRRKGGRCVLVKVIQDEDWMDDDAIPDIFDPEPGTPS